MTEDVELQSLVKVLVKTLDPNSEPIRVTAVSEKGHVCAEQVHRKVCSLLGLHESSWPYFTLLEQGERPIRRYHNRDFIKVNGADLYLCKWCFQTSVEADLVHNDPIAAHLIFLQSRLVFMREGAYTWQKWLLWTVDNFTGGKTRFLFVNSFYKKRTKRNWKIVWNPSWILRPCTSRYVRKPDYKSLHIRQCCLLQSVSTSFVSLKTDSMFDVVVSKLGVKLLAEVSVTFSWFEVSSWSLNKEETTVTLTYAPAVCSQTDIVLKTEQAEFFLAGILEFVKILQLEEKLQSSFHADMITTTQDGRIITWENGLLDHARTEGAQNIL